MYSSRHDNLEIVKLLCENGANINLQDKDGFSALMIATDKGYLEIVKFLLENGANINLQDNNGNSALSIAIGNNDSKIKRILEEA